MILREQQFGTNFQCECGELIIGEIITVFPGESMMTRAEAEAVPPAPVVCPKCGGMITPITLTYEIETVRLNEAGEIVTDDS